MDENVVRRAKTIFLEATELSPDERRSFLDARCGADDDVRGVVEELLRHYDEGLSSFLRSPFDSGASPSGPDSAVDTTPAAPESRSLPEIPGYRIVRWLGEGGMGVVYEAEQESPRRRVALKVIRGGRWVSEQQVKLFRREVESLGRLNHPSIAAIHDAGRTAFGQHYFAMELVGGRPLSSLLGEWREREPTKGELRERLELFLEVCDAIAYAHQRGVIHRDLKPSNVIVREAESVGTTSGRAPRVKLLDFGLARITDADVTLTSLQSETGKIQGTLAYMSPEQARAKPAEIDTRTDIYSLGVMLYELLTGRRPYDVNRAGIPEAIRAICEEEPARPGSIRALVKGDLETIALKALEKDPERRYGSVSALAEDVRRHLSREPILARPPNTAYQLRRLVERHPGAFAFTVALFVVLAGSTAALSVMYGGQKRATERAEKEVAKANSINNFMQSIFASASAEASQGALKEVLDEAAGRIESEFAAQPEILASLHVTMGRSYWSLYALEQARSHLERGIELLRAGGPGSRLDLAGALFACASVLAPHTEAEPEAEAAVREAIEIHRELLGPDDPVLASDLKLLEEVLRKKGSQAEGEVALRESLRILAAARGTENDEYAARLAAVATMASDNGARQEADSLFLAALAIQRRLHPGGDVGTAFTLNGYGCFRWSVGDLDGADRAFRESLEMFRREETDADADFGITFPLRNLADLDRQRGDLDEAAAFNREAMDIRIRLIGEDTFIVSNAQGALARVLSDAGRHEEASAMIDQALGFFRRRDALPAYWTRAWYRDVLTAAGRPEEAETALREWLADAEIRHGPDHFEAAASRLELGQFLMDRHRYPEAEEQLLAGLRIYESCGAHWLGTQPLDLVVDLYEAWGHPEAAALYRKRLAAVTPIEPPGGIFAPRR